MEKESKASIYEVGYLFVPSIAEENLGAKVTSLKDLLGEHGATFIGDEYPKMIELAYEMSRTVLNKKQKFTTGYFGWVKFELSADKINAVKDALDKDEQIIRFLLIKTVRESTLSPKRAYSKEGGARKKPSLAKADEVALPVNEETIDQEIDALVLE